ILKEKKRSEIQNLSQADLSLKQCANLWLELLLSMLLFSFLLPCEQVQIWKSCRMGLLVLDLGEDCTNIS
ncbi:hypothetical protein ACQP3L_34185, partial [Escherichia coli]